MTKKMKENKAGLYVPNRFAEEISDALRSSGMPADFVRGGEVVLGYLNCPEDADMHGTDIADWLANAKAVIERDEMGAIIKLAKETIAEIEETLAGKGIEVADCRVVSLGGDAA